MPPLHPHDIIDVLVVGGGNAGLCSALSASEAGASRVVLIDACPEDWAGGNTYFTAGAFRTVHTGAPDLLPLVNNVDTETESLLDISPYTHEDFQSDMHRMTSGRTDPLLCAALVDDSNSAVKWLATHGVRFQLSFNRQAYHIDGRYKFWGGLALKTQDGGKGLVADLVAAARAKGVRIHFSTRATRLVTDASGALAGVLVTSDGEDVVLRARSTILAAGGFEANPRLRTQHLGPGWDAAHVRGTPFNMGDALVFAVRDVGAQRAGDWAGCHATCWDAESPADRGDRGVGNEFTKSGYPLGLMVNSAGERFVDEGEDLRNFTYARFGRAVGEQPGGVAFQVWDQRGMGWLRDEEYRDGVVRKVWGETVEELAWKLAEGHGLVDRERFVRTVEEYNDAVYANRAERPGQTWDPSVKDGLSTQSAGKKLALPKSNWALPLDRGPFMAVKVCCGVTFTFGGIAVDPETAAVQCGAGGREVRGLYCAGEMLGGLFYGNYPGGSGLTSGAVFGRRAGKAAATYAREEWGRVAGL